MSATEAVSTREAAELLGVTRERVRQLGIDGVLVPTGWGPDGRTWDRASVERYQQQRRDPGRPRTTGASDNV